MLAKESYALYFFRTEKSTLELDFFIHDQDLLIPMELKHPTLSSYSARKPFL